MQVLTPKILLPPVWPPPLSLATTCGISVDVFSSPYLDVSVQAVPHVWLFDSPYVTLRWVSPFGYLRISAHLQLPEAFRSLSRPSSAPDAKAFPLRSFMLDLRRQKLCSFASTAPLSRFVQSSLAPLCLLLKSEPAALGFGFVSPSPNFFVFFFERSNFKSGPISWFS